MDRGEGSRTRQGRRYGKCLLVVPHQQATATTRQDSSRVAAADKNAISDRFIMYDTILTCYLTREEAGPGTSEDSQGLCRQETNSRADTNDVGGPKRFFKSCW